MSKLTEIIRKMNSAETLKDLRRARSEANDFIDKFCDQINVSYGINFRMLKTEECLQYYNHIYDLIHETTLYEESPENVRKFTKYVDKEIDSIREDFEDDEIKALRDDLMTKYWMTLGTIDAKRKPYRSKA